MAFKMKRPAGMNSPVKRRSKINIGRLKNRGGENKIGRELNDDSGLFYNSALKQEGPVPEKNPGVMKGEYEGTYVYEGKGTKGFEGRERIIDLEDRIGFLVENDIPDAKAAGDNKKVEKLQNTVKRLRDELAILRRNVKADKTPIKK